MVETWKWTGRGGGTGDFHVSTLSTHFDKGGRPMKTVHYNAAAPHFTFPIQSANGEYEVDAFFSVDGRLTELCIAGENGAIIDEETCGAAASAALCMGKLIKASREKKIAE
jgi:hypothetical protein